MNTLILFVDEYKDSNELVRHGIRRHDAVVIRILIDGEDVFANRGFEDAAVVYSELLASIDGSGRYLIFTCFCGIAEDGGWEGVMVRHDDQVVSWQLDVGDRRIEYRFDMDNYRTEILSVQSFTSSTSLTLQPSNVVFPLSFSREI